MKRILELLEIDTNEKIDNVFIGGVVVFVITGIVFGIASCI